MNGEVLQTNLPKEVAEFFGLPSKPTLQPKKEEVVEVVVKTTKTKKVKSLKEKIDDIKEIQVENFEKLIESGTIEDFKHTKNGQELKILKITEFISDFKAFNEWLIKNGSKDFALPPMLQKVNEFEMMFRVKLVGDEFER